MHWICFFFLNLWLKTCKALHIWVCPSFFLSLSASLPSFFSSEVISFYSLGWPRMMDRQHLPYPYTHSDLLVLVSRALGLQARTFPPDPLIPLVVWYPVSSSIKFYISCGSQVLGKHWPRLLVCWRSGVCFSVHFLPGCLCPLCRCLRLFCSGFGMFPLLSSASLLCSWKVACLLSAFTVAPLSFQKINISWKSILGLSTLPSP